MKRLGFRESLHALGTAMALAVPAVAIGIGAFLVAWNRRSPLGQGRTMWMVALVPPLLIFAAVALTVGRVQDAATWSGQAAIVVIIGLIPASTAWVRSVGLGTAVGVIAVVGGVAFISQYADRLNLDAEAPWTIRSRLELPLRTVSPTEELAVNLTTRRTRAPAQVGWWSQSSDVGVAVEQPGSATDTFVRLSFPADRVEYASLALDSGAPAGGRLFRVTAELRSGASASAARLTPDVTLQHSDDPLATRTQKTSVSRAWTPVDVLIDVAPGATDPNVLLVVNGVQDAAIDVRNVRLYEFVNLRWEPIAPRIDVSGPGDVEDATTQTRVSRVTMVRDDDGRGVDADPWPRLDLKTLEAKAPAPWTPSTDGVRIELAAPEVEASPTRIEFPENVGDAFATFSVDVGAPAGGRTFRVRADVRSVDPVPYRPTRGLWIQSWDANGSTSIAAEALGPEWTTLASEIRFDPAVLDPVVRVVLNDFDGYAVEVRNVAVSERLEDRWVALSIPVARSSFLSAAASVPVPQLNAQFRASYRVPVRTGMLERFELGIEPVGPDAVEVVDLDIRSESAVGAVVRDVAPPRLGWWLGHPNVAGHAIALAGLAWFASVRRPRHRVAVTAVAAVAVFVTGSRTAWIALTAGITGLVVSNGWRAGGARRWITVSAAVVALTASSILLVAAFGRGNLLEGDDGNVTSRIEIWQFAARSILEDPLKGIGGLSFDEAWSDAHGGSTDERIGHAHDVLLEAWMRYGLAGAVAVAWLFGALLFGAARTAGGAGFSVVFSLGVLQAFDTTLWTAAVLLTFRWLWAAVVEDVPARSEPGVPA